MLRTCRHCGHAFTPSELCRDASKEIEAQRKTAHVEGLHFRCYACAQCGFDNLFVDLHPVPGESDEEYRRRKHDLEEFVRQLHPEGAEIVLIERTAAE